MAFITSSVLPRTGLSHGTTAVCVRPANTHVIVAAPIDIQAAKHVQFKAAKKKDRYRPKKRRPSDITRAPPSFDVEPLRAEGISKSQAVAVEEPEVEDIPATVAETVAEVVEPESEGAEEPKA